MKNFSKELIEKAKKAASVTELLDIAKENDVELNEDQAKTYFTQLAPKTGELSDDELDNVSGGGCGGGGCCPACGGEPLWIADGCGGVNIRCLGCGVMLDYNSSLGGYIVME